MLHKEISKGSFSFQQLFVGSNFRNLSVLQHHNFIHLGQKSNAVGNENSRLNTIIFRLIQRERKKTDTKTYLLPQNTTRSDDFVENMFAHVTVHGAERIVQKINVQIGINGSGQTDALLLSTAEVDSL